FYGAGFCRCPYNEDSDSFTNIGKTRTLHISHKIFYYASERSTFWLVINANLDKSEGRYMEVVSNEVGAYRQYFETNESNRISTQAAYELSLGDDQDITVKTSVSFFDRVLTLPGYTFDGKQTNTFSEISYAKRYDKSDWIFGANLYTDSFIEN